MPSADPNRALPGGGPAPLITLKTHPPLPSFSIPHRVPDPSTEISSFKLSILGILTGQTNAQSSTKPLTFSEEVKEKAINGWKMQMLTLELCQRDDLEAEQQTGQNAEQDSAEMRGFELQDHHECSLIEQGDMIVVRLKPNHSIEELELPKLGSAHRYSAPAASLTRAGTLSEPPPYSIIQPSEPSSFSSSVGAQPNANYHQHRYQDYRSSFRVVTANNVGSGHIRRTTASNPGYTTNPTALGQGLNLLQSSSGKAAAPKTKRRASATATATANTTARPSASPKLGSSAALPAIASVDKHVNPASENPSTTSLAASTVDQQHTVSPPTSPRLDSGVATPVSATRRNSSSVVTVQANQRSSTTAAATSSSPNPNAMSGSQFAGLPAAALVIGPGVQGQVGRNPTSVNAPMGASGPAELEYGNAKGFVNFTSAGSADIRTKPKRRPSRQGSQEFYSDSNVLDSSAARRRPSNPGAAEKRAALARQASGEAIQNGARPAKERQVSGGRITVAGKNGDATVHSGTASRSAAPPVAPASSGDGNGLTGQRIELGLERITLLLSRLKNPHRSFPIIHVAGTNGKGSTIAYLDSLLRNALDIRTATFVSPHLIERRDCCKVDGRVIDKSVWRQAQSDVLFANQGLDIPATADDDGQPLKSSPFELLTAQTFQAFSLLPERERPEVLLIEVGLGGRLDATNVFEQSQVLASVICPIDRDHEAFLGSQLEGIAREKAGIVKDRGLCIIADQRLDDLSPVDQLALGPLENETKQLGARAAGILDSIRNVCMSRNARLVKTYVPWKLLSLPPTKQAHWGSSVDFTPKLAPTLFLSTSGLNPPSTFVAHPHDPVMFSVPVSVERTRANLTGVCMAIQTLSSIARDEWAQDPWEDLRTRIMWGLRDDPESNLRVRESLNAVKWAGRCSWFNVAGREVLIDGAHNESSAVALREYIENCLASRSLSSSSKGKKGQWEVTYIFAFSEGKDYESMVRALLDNPSELVERQNVGLTTFSPPEGMPWVRSVELQDSLAVLKVGREVDVGELRTFESINEAIQWSAGKSGKEKGEKGPVVIAGSLYLVADMYRYLQSIGLYPTS
ncbi:hypothetical protein NDA16_003621 [Ustilago loliicola]|nr:hypothetical protein NDA16_003621 [Ustilago loliicola]